MGVWGTGLYSDDTACDVRDDYKDILGDGVTEPSATDLIIEKWKNEISDPEISLVFWLVLADVQWNLGRLQERVKQEAIKIIENDSDLTRWSSAQKLITKRKPVLSRLKRKLETSQPIEKVVKKRYVNSTDWQIGDVFCFRLHSGTLALLHVIGFHEDYGGRGPVCEILEWSGESTPDKKEIEKMGFKSANQPYQHLSQFLFAALSSKDFQEKRVRFVTKDIKPKQKLSGYGVILWRLIDREFDDLFGLQ
ncbi:MAG: hypothetical protein WBI14_09295 [Anaerolineaceae bacterium]